jgi:hypothetical protein
MKLIPYVLNDGAYSLPDSAMLHIWATLEKHGLDKVLFYSGGMDAEKFLRFMKVPQNVVHTIWEEDRIQMIAWINGFGVNHAFAHFCCFPETWGKNSVELGRNGIKYWFDFKKDDGTPVLDVIAGFTPAGNHKAVGYIKKVGMNIMGTIPDIRCGDKKDGMVFSYITREEVNGRQ